MGRGKIEGRYGNTEGFTYTGNFNFMTRIMTIQIRADVLLQIRALRATIPRIIAPFATQQPSREFLSNTGEYSTDCNL